jgi:tetratricopeptide (TPR) repeat protein
VCANKVAYPPFRGAIAGPRRVDGSPQWFIPPPPPPPEPVRGGRGAPPPPVEASDEFRDLADPNTVMRDYFKECRPLNPRSQFLAPTWFVLGKHFHGRYAREFNDENMEWAISAFRRVVELGPQGNPYYAFALAEIGHALSAMNRYDEGMGPYLLFLQKLQAGEFGEYQSKAEGQRTNVLNGIATNLIYNYWMGPRAQQDPATRAADPTVIPQDAEWFQALMETLVEECCEPPSDRCDTWQKKVGVYRLFIQRFPLHPKVPQMLRKLVDLFRENAAEGDQAGRQGLLEAIECLALFRRSGGAGAGAGGAAPVIAAGHANSLCPDPTVGQRWWEENRDNPELIEEAEQEAEGALQDAAGQYHAAAQTHQANCDAGVEESCALATRMYELAVEAYRRLIQEYPQSAFTYDNMFNLAGCFYSIGRIDEAFEQFQAVEASTLSNVYQRDALFNQVAILSNEFRETGNTLIPEQAPSHEVTQQTPDGEVTLTVPDPVEPLPPLVANLHAVMTRWIERYPDDPASLGYRRMIASQLYFLAHWDRAEATYEQLFQEYCPNPAQAELAMDAYQILDTLANFRQDRERIEQLREWQTGECFSASETGQTIRDRTRDQVIGEQFFAASQRFLRAGDAADPAAEYRGAARDLLEVVAQNLDSPNSPAAIRMAAIAYSRAEEPVRAVETWSQLIQHCSPPSPHVERCARATEPGNRVSLPEAHFYVAIYAMQTFDLDEARRSFQALERSAGRPVRGERLRKVEECINDERRPCTDAEYTAEAVRNIAGISRLQGSYPEAARLTERMLSEGYTRSTEEATRLRLDVVQLYNEGSAWNDMRRAADEYLRTFESDRARRFDVLRVRWILYKDAERQRDRRAMDRASTMLETAYNRLSAEEKAIVPAGLDAAKGQLVINVQEILARPRFEAFDGKFREFERVQFEPRSLRQLVNDVKTYKDNLIRLSRELTAGYVTVIRDFPVSPTWGVAARYRISYVWNNLAYRMATMGQRMRTEWLELVVNDQTGETLSDLLDTVASEIRGVEAEPGTGITIEMIIRWYLIGDGSAEVQGVVGAVPYARSTGGTNEWSRQAIQLVQQLSLSQDPTQLFANGRLPEVTGEALGGGLDPVAQ